MHSTFERRRIGPYELVEELGRGRMARVHTARRIEPETELVRVAAVKIINADLAQDESLRKQFRREIETNLMFEHPYVIPTLLFGVDGGFPWYSMPIVPGLSFEMMRERVFERGAEDPLGMYLDVVLRSAVHVCEGLHAAHTAEDPGRDAVGLVHRDISPTNLLLGADGIARVLDFGIAGRARTALETATKELFGTAYYVAPERVEDHKDKDPRQDIWSLGAVLWEMVTGRRLFQGKNLVDIMRKIVEQKVPDIRDYQPEAPAMLADIIDKALKRQRLRTGSALEMGRALSGFLRAERRLVTSGEAALWLRTIGQDEIERIRGSARLGRLGRLGKRAPGAG